MALLGSPQSRSRRRSAPDTDLLIWTPYACTLVVLADFGSVQHGVLTTGPTGRWQVGDGIADVRTGKSAPNPILRGRRIRNELAALFRRHGLSEQIDVLVVLIPKTGSRITWTPPSPEDGIETVLVRIGRSEGLAEYFERSATGPVRWRGEDIERAFEVLGAARYLPDPDELDQEGFVFASGRAAGSRAAAGAPAEPMASGEPGPVAVMAAASTLPPGRSVPGDSVVSPRSASTEADPHPPIRDSGLRLAPMAAPDTHPERGEVLSGTDPGPADPGASPIGAECRAQSEPGNSAGMRATDTPARGRTGSDRPISGPDAGVENGPAGQAARESGVGGADTDRGWGSGVFGGTAAEPQQRPRVSGRETGWEPMVRTGSPGAPAEQGGPAATDEKRGPAAATAEQGGWAAATDEQGGPAAATAGYGSAAATALGGNATAISALPQDGVVHDAGNANDFRTGSGRLPVRSALRRRFGAGGSGPGRRPPESATASGIHRGAGEPGGQAVPGPAHGFAADHDPDGPARIGSRSSGHDGRDFDDPAAAPASDRDHRIGDRVPAPLRRGLAGLREVPARARRAAAGPRPAARPPRQPWVGHAYGEPARRGKDLRYPAALGLAGVVLAAVAATVFAASGFARFDVTEYGALCAGGEGNPAAAPYSAAGPSPVYLAGELPEYTAFGPSAVWRPIDSAAVQLVACVGQERRGGLVHTCQYPAAPGQPVGRTLNLFTAVYRLTVYEARTGGRLASMEITGDEFGTDPAAAQTDPCRAAAGAPEDGLPGRRYSRPSHQQIEQALTPFVAPASPRIRAAR
ncbi:hypothetical protein ACPESR_30840 [Nocardia testacea]|uniref:hypothetical protein n=1 Tax=Nocardia testacea TaxID=248551 RepID=UPI003C2ADC40